MATVVLIQTCLKELTKEKVEGSDAGVTSLTEKLRHLVDEARAQLWTLFAMKQKVIYSESMLIIFSLQHMPPAERMFAWIGTVRPSKACAGVLEKLGSSLSAGKKQQLEQLKVRHF
jgi:Seed dormancy control